MPKESSSLILYAVSALLLSAAIVQSILMVVSYRTTVGVPGAPGVVAVMKVASGLVAPKP